MLVWFKTCSDVWRMWPDYGGHSYRWICIKPSPCVELVMHIKVRITKSYFTSIVWTLILILIPKAFISSIKCCSSPAHHNNKYSQFVHNIWFVMSQGSDQPSTRSDLLACDWSVGQKYTMLTFLDFTALEVNSGFLRLCTLARKEMRDWKKQQRSNKTIVSVHYTVQCT